MLFEQLGLGPEILKAVADAGYTSPTPIQAEAIPTVLQGHDVLGCAQTGSVFHTTNDRSLIKGPRTRKNATFSDPYPYPRTRRTNITKF